MTPAEDDDAEEGPFGAPLPPDDRLWRHPSEMSSEANKQQIVLVSKGGVSLTRTLVVAVLASLIGAGTVIAVVAGTGAFVREKQGETAVQKQVVPPAEPKSNDIAIAAPVLPAIARVEAVGPDDTTRVGTAVVFRSNGLLITTADAVDAAQVYVTLNDGSRLDAHVIGRSPDADIAILKVERNDLPVAVGSRRKVVFGDQIRMIDAANDKGPEISVGVVTGPNLAVSNQNEKTLYGLIQVTTQATVTSRSAGTVLVDESGTVIGFVSSRAEPPTPTPPPSTSTLAKGTTGTTGTRVPDPAETRNSLHFATAADFAWDIAIQLADNGQVVRPDIGLQGVTIDAQEAKQLGRDGGMRITSVERDGPAAKAGLRVDDVIVGVDPEDACTPTCTQSTDNISSYNDYVVALRHHKPQDQVRITFSRGLELDSKLVMVRGKPEQQ